MAGGSSKLVLMAGSGSPRSMRRGTSAKIIFARLSYLQVARRLPRLVSTFAARQGNTAHQYTSQLDSCILAFLLLPYQHCLSNNTNARVRRTVLKYSPVDLGRGHSGHSTCGGLNVPTIALAGPPTRSRDASALSHRREGFLLLSSQLLAMCGALKNHNNSC